MRAVFRSLMTMMSLATALSACVTEPDGPELGLAEGKLQGSDEQDIARVNNATDSAQTAAAPCSEGTFNTRVFIGNAGCAYGNVTGDSSFKDVDVTVSDIKGDDRCVYVRVSRGLYNGPPYNNEATEVWGETYACGVGRTVPAQYHGIPRGRWQFARVAILRDDFGPDPEGDVVRWWY